MGYFLLEHRRNITNHHNEIGDSGFIPCGIFNTRAEAIDIADKNTPEQIGVDRSWTEDWSDNTWNDGRISSTRYYGVENHGNEWRIVPVSIGQFQLIYSDGKL